MSSEAHDIEKIALLARLSLTASEKDKLGKQFHQIVDYIDQLNRLDTDNVEPTSHVLPLHNVLREDEARKIFSETDYLKQAPRQDKGHYEVPKIL